MIVSFLWVILSVVSATSPLAGQTAGTTKSDNKFPIYDNMAYKGKPDTAKDGLVPSNVVYENRIWPDRRMAGALPDQTAFQALVRTEATNPGPLVIDIETISLRSPLAVSRHNVEILAQLADWAHQAVPGKVVGFYATNIFLDLPPDNLEMAKELAKHTDAFFTPLYSFDEDRARWEGRAKKSQEELHSLDPTKPIYFYLWPQFHVGSARALRYVDGDFWKFQLETARRYGDGIVLWGSNTYVWNPKSGWWDATQKFAASLR